jgi:signal transduction histidine kinase
MQSSISQEHLLARYQQALGHDLPNKLVALQGIARLLGQELDGQLSGEAKDWLTRVVCLTMEIDNQVRTLADIGRACKQTGLVATINLAELWSEVRTEVAWQKSDRTIRCDSCFAEPIVVLPERSLRRVLVELMRYAVHRSLPGKDLRLVLSSERLRSDLVLVSLQDNALVPPHDVLEQALSSRVDGPQGSLLGLFLARLLVEGWGGTMRLSTPSEGGCLVTLEVPQGCEGRSS